MIPRRIMLENFLSFGSPATEIEFTDDEPLWVLGGPNGVGKSAVFDAMTYALYAEHRGGATDHTSLIRHGANSFRVVFEFEFNKVAYQITRNRPLTGRPTQGIKQWVDGGWNKTVQLPPAAGRQDQVRIWAVQTLGLDFDAFTASVLLRQGQADEIITATGSRRLAILKKIIGAERYEALSQRVHTAARCRKERHEALCDKRDVLTRDKGIPPTELELQIARETLTQMEEARQTAHDQVGKALERLTAAKTWATLDAKCNGLNRQIQEADTRAAAAEHIRAEKARLDDLTAAVPVLRELVAVRVRLAVDKPRFEALQLDLGELTAEECRLTMAADQARQKGEAHRIRGEHHDREAARLRGEIDRDNKCLVAADEVTKLQLARDDFSSDLPKQLDEAREQVKTAAEALETAGQARATTAGLLKQAKLQQQKFATVGAGVKCSLCGQEVTEEHTERERARLASDAHDLQRQVREAEAAENLARDTKDAADGTFYRLDEQCRKYTQTCDRLATKRQSLADFGVTADADELRRQLAETNDQALQHERDRDTEQTAQTAARKEAIRLDGEHQTAAGRLKLLTEQIRIIEQEISRTRGRHDGLVGQLTPSWREQAADLGRPAVDRLDAERLALDCSGVSQRFRELEQDVARREEWMKHLEEVNNEIEKIPSDARIPVVNAEDGVKRDRTAAQQADTKRDETKETANNLANLAAEHAKLVTDIRDAERQSELHRKLDDLLGKGGLQRELVRSAEREIVRLAKDTLQNLSDGGLTVEVEDSTDDDEAFALRIRQADKPAPTGVNYLSGSEKFRVAVSVALAIGRFAAGQARPLESVIIDEGFGSLDRDGLRAAADELNRLRQHLRRIIVVSHQEEFAKRFPVVIQLSHGENGTTAAAVRQ
jgi:DNA repair protein SbcC/Rad50